MRYHLFLHCGGFLQNLEEDFIRTNMHTTVVTYYVVKRVKYIFSYLRENENKFLLCTTYVLKKKYLKLVV